MMESAVVPLTALGGLAAVLYFVAGGLSGLRWSKASGALSHPPHYKLPLIVLGWLAVLLHGVTLLEVIVVPEGLNMAFFNALSLTTWFIAVLLLLLTLAWPLENLGVVLLPLSGASLLLALAFPARHIVADTIPWQLELHIALSIVAYGLLTLATTQGVLVGYQDRRLRQRRPKGLVGRLPPLTAMEAVLFQLMGAGFAVLSLALLSGLFFLQDIFAQSLVHKTVLSFLAWGLFGVLLWGRWHFGWRGRTVSRWLVGGFCTLALGYFGSKFVLELILGR
ncbi:MAG: inner membrane protein YpjD [Candidatus Competibacterales bacterium]